jgi:hypothetical protein
MVSEVPAVKAVWVSLALSRGHGPRVKAVKDRRSWYGHQHGQYRRPLVSCSCSPLLLLCSGIEMRLLLAAPPSLLTSDHLFWVYSPLLVVSTSARVLTWKSPCESQVRCCSRLRRVFLRISVKRQRRWPCPPEKLQLLCSITSTRDSVLLSLRSRGG